MPKEFTKTHLEILRCLVANESGEKRLYNLVKETGSSIGDVGYLRAYGLVDIEHNGYGIFVGITFEGVLLCSAYRNRSLPT